MKRFVLAVAAVAFLALACEHAGPTNPPTSNASSAIKPLFGADNNGNGVIHRVSVGGPDADVIFPDDKNFSLIAVQKADGSVQGEWTDRFGGDQGGIHVDVDCVNVSDDSATISGIIRNGTLNGVDVSGQQALTRVWDRGTSANDPPDQISFSFFPVGVNCFYAGPLTALDMTRGQVKVD